MHDTVAQNAARTTVAGLIALLRPKQWVKNGFVLAPLIFAGEFTNATSIKQAFLSSLLFCIGASAAYILNDFKDIDQDRKHPEKSRSRPLATGAVSQKTATTTLILLYASLAAAWIWVPNVVFVITGYLVLNIAYTYYLKHQPVLDIFTIAIGFVLRVYAGAVAISVPVSNWMFITTLCLALYLAAIKRRQELVQRGIEGRNVLGKYSLPLIERYAEMAATGALVFYSLFVVTARPALVLTIPLVLFGLFRYWYVVDQLDGGESPTDALLGDGQLVATVLVWVLACVWAILQTSG